MVDIINNLYNLALFLLWGCLFISVAAVGYIVGIIKYAKKCTVLNEELEKIKINNMINKENI
ncbi:hypothetical protein [Clostridium beijerinckii]|uniref:hypothetical protein n=1 Tax=Clostridium beijerinckii TaxID=1520 RepID=UPI00232B01F7|nr:hypothetical protein [Clostridium beijerinckii]